MCEAVSLASVIRPKSDGARCSPTICAYLRWVVLAADVSTVTWVVVDNPIRFSPSGIVFSQSFGPMTNGLATFFEMDQTSTNQTQADAMAILASFINTSSPGNLGAPTGGLRAGGQINVNSSSGTDASTIEVAAF